MKNYGIIIEARTGSTRFPNKVIKKIGNLTLLDYLIDRVKCQNQIKKIIIATTKKKKDNKIIKIAKKNKINFFRGSENDLIDRISRAAKKNNIENIIQVTADNPFFDNIYKKSEIFCFGLQSPRRFSFDKLTNDFLVPDISKKSWQEINWNSWGVSKNANFGWNLMEGNHCFDQEIFCDTTELIMPSYEYPSNVSYIKKLINMGNEETYGCAVVGGYVYRGDKHYTLYGSYVFGDHCSNQIWVLNKNKNGKP